MSFIPSVDKDDVVSESYYMDNYVVLKNGCVIKTHGDGTAHDELGYQWVQISKMVEEDEYEFIGWSLTSNLK